MYEESKYFQAGNIRIYWYGVFIALGALSLLLCLSRLAKKRIPDTLTVPVYGVVSLPLGIICSRLVFCLLDFRFHGMFSLQAVLQFWGGGFSMIGALAGTALAALLTTRLLKSDILTLMDILFPSAMLFIFFARLGEGFTELLGRSRTLNAAWLTNTPLVWSDGYDTYLNTWLLEAATAALLHVILCRVTLPKCSRKGDTLLTGMLLLGCTQVFWESLRFDSHMRFSFVSMQQILFACMYACPLILFAIRCGKKALITAVIAVALSAGGAVGVEFLIDRSEVSNIICYCLYALLLALPAALGIHFRNRGLTT